MASIALFAFGATVAPGIFGLTASTTLLGGAITAGAFFGATFGAIGAYIDSQFLFPALFGPDNQRIEGPRVEDIQLQLASEGSPVRKCYGPENKIAGTVIWMTDLEEVEIEESRSIGGGKGGGGGGSVTTTQYQYFIDVAIGVCEGPIENIRRIWADDKLIWYNDNGTTIAPSGATETGTDIFAKGTVGEGANFYAPINGSDLSKFKTGETITVAGFTDASPLNPGTPFNGEWEVIGYRSNVLVDTTADSQFQPCAGDIGSGLFQVLSCRQADFDHKPCVSPGDSVTLTTIEAANIPSVATDRYDDLTVYRGTTSQDQDSVIAAVEGAENVPAWRGISYFRIDKLALADFGNRLPRFSMEVEADITLTVGECIAEILERYGFESSEYDVSRVGQCIRGYNTAGPQQGNKVLEPVMLAYNISVSERDGKLVFRPRGEFDIVTVPASKLAVHEFDKEAPRVIEIKDGADVNLPNRVDVDYIDADQGYQKAQERAHRNNTPYENTQGISIPLTFSATEANALGQQLLWQAWIERQKASIRLGPQFMYLHEGDAILTEDRNGNEMIIRGQRIGRGANGILEISGPLTDAGVFDVEDVAVDRNYEDDTLYRPPALLWLVANMPPLRSSEVNIVGIAAACQTVQPGVRFIGAAVLGSTDDATFTRVGVVQSQSILGEARQVYTPSRAHYTFQDIPFLIEIQNGTLTTEAEEDVAAGANRIVLAQPDGTVEILGFTTATNVGGNRWELTGVISGMYGTEDQIGNHEANQPVAIVEQNDGSIDILDNGSITATRYYKVVAVGQDASVVTSDDIVVTGRAVTNFAPANIRSQRYTNTGDVWVELQYRSRKPAAPWQAEVDTVDEPSYYLEVYYGGQLITTISSVDGGGYLFLASDFGTGGLLEGIPLGDPFTVRFYSHSPIVGDVLFAEGVV